MGFDPSRPRRRRPTDVLYVLSAVAVVTIAMAWALFA
jgi:hypothetical protein